ncbi:MAG: molybdenum cofactor guanylyltransferase MobA [Burkholderiaceae bacterium]
MSALPAGNITALVLAGGRGTRMGGVEKGLQPFNGIPLARHALNRLKNAADFSLGGFALNANNHLDTYGQWGVPVWTDVVDGQLGPLAGMLTGLRHCPTSHLLTVPCDAPAFPVDLPARLAHALALPDADIAVACAPDEHGTMRRHAVFALMPAALASDLEAYLQQGGRKVGQWLQRHRSVDVAFNGPQDAPSAFENINTLEQLRALESRGLPDQP